MNPLSFVPSSNSTVPCNRRASSPAPAPSEKRTFLTRVQRSSVVLPGLVAMTISPMRRPLSIDDLGNSAVYLCSDMSRGTTGEIHYVDGGYNIIGVPEVVD